MKKNTIVLIGDEKSKANIFFNEIIDRDIYDFINMSWENIDIDILEKATLVKLNAPKITNTEIKNVMDFVQWYKKELFYLESFENINYLNKPKAIFQTLDKVYTKKLLEKNNIPTTEMIYSNIIDYENLKKYLILNDIKEVFIKLRYGSGAGGIVVYKYNKQLDKDIIYTTIMLKENTMYNVKNIIKVGNTKKIKSIINMLLKQDVIIEKSVPKERIGSLTYDLRVVYQFGKIEFIVARGSSGPITNLHLNNNPLALSEINLTNAEIEKIESLCASAVALYDGLNVAGIDVLVTPNREFKIIEINAQGDLIYQDIYNENIIYKNQLKFIKDNSADEVI